ncbi:MAG: formate--tetrahydrofolate ligase [Erysipelotrichaceae bacterium]|nr:formate--tetrahydrofolate ligase [Erysipelotrichaceae bacterium]
MKPDIEIARETTMFPIKRIITKNEIDEKYVDYIGKYKAKISLDYFKELKSKRDGKLVLVTAINPTSAGEGKTTMSIALAQGLSKINEKVILALREPSMGPVFGIKGGATGGGYSQVLPMEDINLHFTGDMHAITSCNNLISAVIDNHIFQGNQLNIDPNKVVWKRCLDVNDRALREVEIVINKNIKRKESFNITVASEVMAIMCLSTSLKDFKERIGKCIVAYTYEGKAITINELGIAGSCASLMAEALKPNLVQTIEHVPALIHGGPFANIAHGCSSLIGTKMALKLADWVVTEAGFGADLGAEKFLDIKCQIGNLKPSAVVIVATTRALKLHGGATNCKEKNIEALVKGFANLERHVQNIQKYKLPFVICINHFENDYDEEVEILSAWCKQHNYPVSFCDGFLKGGKGSIDLANKVKEIADSKNDFTPIYEKEDLVEAKILRVCKEIYGAKRVVYSEKAKQDLDLVYKLGLEKSMVCIAKTQYSFSDDQKLLNAPTDFNINIKEIRIASGAGFIVVITGSILTMPGLPKEPAALSIDINEEGTITGLF